MWISFFFSLFFFSCLGSSSLLSYLLILLLSAVSPSNPHLKNALISLSFLSLLFSFFFLFFFVSSRRVRDLFVVVPTVSRKERERSKTSPMIKMVCKILTLQNNLLVIIGAFSSSSSSSPSSRSLYLASLSLSSSSSVFFHCEGRKEDFHPLFHQSHREKEKKRSAEGKNLEARSLSSSSSLSLEKRKKARPYETGSGRKGYEEVKQGRKAVVPVLKVEEDRCRLS